MACFAGFMPFLFIMLIHILINLQLGLIWGPSLLLTRQLFRDVNDDIFIALSIFNMPTSNDVSLIDVSRAFNFHDIFLLVAQVFGDFWIIPVKLIHPYIFSMDLRAYWDTNSWQELNRKKLFRRGVVFSLSEIPP